MDRRTSDQAPASPEAGPVTPSVHAGDGVELSSPLGSPSPAAGTDLTITKSDLAALMGCVKAAIALYNVLEGDRYEHDMTYANEFDALGSALDKLEVPKA